MKAAIALLIPLVGTLFVSPAVFAQATDAVQGIRSEPGPIPADFNEVSVDSDDLTTEAAHLQNQDQFSNSDDDTVTEISLYQGTQRTFPGPDEIYRDPGPANPDLIRFLLIEGDTRPRP